MSENPRKVNLSHGLLNEANLLLREDTQTDIIAAAQLLMDAIGQPGRITTRAKAFEYLKLFYKKLLNQDLYLECATLLFGQAKFDSGPACARKICQKMRETNKLIIIGASSMSKSYTAGTMNLLDYIRDPEFTKVRIGAPTAEHLRSNLFGHMVDLVMCSAIPLGLHAVDLFIGLNPNKRDYSISGVTFPQDEHKAYGRFKGLKAGQRGHIHPQFGGQGRVRLLLDEGSTIPASAYMDLPSIIASITNTYTIKICICANPEEAALTRKLGELSKPKDADGGWDGIDIDEDFEWVSEKGYDVLRLDADQCENIIEDRIVFEGLQTPQGYKDIQALGHADYMTFCRGMFPLAGSKSTVISPASLHSNIGKLVYPYGTVRIASIDVAKGNDQTEITTALWGQASGIEHMDGTKEIFPEPKYMCQPEQQFTVEVADDILKISREIIRVLKGMNVLPKWTGLDATSLGSGVYSYLSEYFGDVLGIEWGESPSETKIFAEDKKTPKQLYSRQSDEMWFATGRWMTQGIFKFLPTMETNQLFHELSTRRIHNGEMGTRKARVEQKKQWKSRNGNKSPDKGDSFVQLQQIIRMRDTNLPGYAKDGERVIDVDEGNFPKNVAKTRNLIQSIRK